MNSEIIVALIQNIAILLALVFIYSLVLSNRLTDKPYYKIAVGIFNGLIGILLMSTALHLANGVIFDTRSILISVSGMFLGAIPTAIAAIVMIAYRIYLGGPGMIVGVVVVFSTSILGIVANKYYFQKIISDLKNRSLKFYLFGVIVHVDMLLCMLLLPKGLKLETLSSISLPVIILYPLGTYLLCKILFEQMEKHNLLDIIAESEEKYRNLAENTSDMIWTMDTDLKLTYLSPASLRIFGEPPESYLSQTIMPRIIPEDRELLMNFLNNILAQKSETQITNNRPWILECRYEKNDGSAMWISVSANGIWDSQGNVTGLTGTVRDIDHLKHVEIDNNRQTALMVSIIDSIPDLIFYKDTNGVCQGGNQAFIQFCNKPKHEIFGKTDYDLFPQELAENFTTIDKQLLKDKTLRRDEETIVYPDGSTRIFDTLKTPFWLSEGNIGGIIGISRDITERKQKE